MQIIIEPIFCCHVTVYYSLGMLMFTFICGSNCVTIIEVPSFQSNHNLNINTCTTNIHNYNYTEGHQLIRTKYQLLYELVDANSTDSFVVYLTSPKGQMTLIEQ